MQKETFIFEDNLSNIGLEVTIPAGLCSKSSLLELFGQLLKFPDYYGANWDAFEECLRDLSWLKEKVIVIRQSEIYCEKTLRIKQ